MTVHFYQKDLYQVKKFIILYMFYFIFILARILKLHFFNIRFLINLVIEIINA